MRTLLTVVLVMAAAAVAMGKTPTELWSFQGIEDIRAFAALPDADGDGVSDILVETYDAGAVGDHLYLLSGASSGTAQVIWSARPVSGVSDGGGYGQECLVSCDDLNDDGFPDVLLSTAWGNRSVHALDGLTGQVLWSFDTYREHDSGWIYTVRTHPDRTGDGRPEVVFGVGSENHYGYMLDGNNGLPIWRFTGSCDAIGHTVSLPDVNGDGTADVLFCGWDYENRVFCVSGSANGITYPLWSRDTGSSNYSATLIDDVTGDGVGEIVVGLWSASNQVLCLDGADGTTVWTFHNGAYNYIMRLVTVDDVDGDGVRDIAVGSWSNGLPVLSGQDGSLIWISYAGTTNGGDFWTVDGVDDLDSDGIGEVVGGSFDHQVYLFSGADGDTLWTFETADRLYAVFGGPDLSGTGSADVLGGTQYLSSGGRAHALEGGADITAAPDLPEAGGQALRLADRVELDWQVSEPLPCVVDRYADDGEKTRVERLELAESFARGDLDTRDVLASIQTRNKALAATRITHDPLLPDGACGAGWSYRFVDPDAPAGLVTYRVSTILPDGRNVAVLELRPSAGATPRAVLQSAQVTPNPFNPRTNVRFALERAATVIVDVHDAAGRRVARLGPDTFEAGDHSLVWDGTAFDGRALPSGLYLLRVQTGGESRTLKAALVR